MNVSQATPNPTNKLTAAMVGVFLVEVAKLVVKNMAPEFYEETLWVAMSPIAVIVAGYFIKDQANVSVGVVVDPEMEKKATNDP